MTRYFGLAAIIGTVIVYGQQSTPDSHSAHEKHMKEGNMADHQKGMDHRGDHAMGFSHEKTTHHFLLQSHGGLIAVEANDSQDTASRDDIRKHLTHIAQMFSAGNFSAPMFIHDQVPPGVPTMKRLKARITYKYESLAHGGQVRIVTKDVGALAAVHDFLRFQITDHQTGDPLMLEKKSQ
jgi:hypothetical protein